MTRYPLEGIRVLDLCPLFAGNFANCILADLGAEVIKVESTQYWQYAVRGAIARVTKEFLAQMGAMGVGWGYPLPDPGPEPWNAYGGFHGHSRNKLSMTVDLRRPEGVEIFKRLIKASDVFIESNMAETVENLGIDYPQLKEVNPALIMLRMPGYGISGPYRARHASAQTLESFSGHTLLWGYPDMDLSANPSGIFSNAAAGAGAASAVLMALRYRSRTGKGQLIDFAQVENFMPVIGQAIMDSVFNGRVQTTMGNRDPSAAPCGCYTCSGQEQWVNITVRNDEEWESLCRALGNPDWAKDPKFATVPGRYGSQDELDRHISEWTRSRDKYEVMRLLQREGVACGPVIHNYEVFEDPHLVARGQFQEIEGPPALGTYLTPGIPWKMSRTPLRIQRPAPRLGQHNGYVYQELLGYSDEEYARLEAEGHIGTEPAPHIP